MKHGCKYKIIRIHPKIKFVLSIKRGKNVMQTKMNKKIIQALYSTSEIHYNPNQKIEKDYV